MPHQMPTRAIGTASPSSVRSTGPTATSRRSRRRWEVAVPAAEYPWPNESWRSEAAGSVSEPTALLSLSVKVTSTDRVRVGLLGVGRVEQRVERVVDEVLARDVAGLNEDRADD